MKFLIIGILCIVFGVMARQNPQGIREFLNKGNPVTQHELDRTSAGGTIILVCGILLLILGVITIIVEYKKNH